MTFSFRSRPRDPRVRPTINIVPLIEGRDRGGLHDPLLDLRRYSFRCISLTVSLYPYPDPREPPLSSSGVVKDTKSGHSRPRVRTFLLKGPRQRPEKKDTGFRGEEVSRVRTFRDRPGWCRLGPRRSLRCSTSSFSGGSRGWNLRTSSNRSGSIDFEGTVSTSSDLR